MCFSNSYCFHEIYVDLNTELDMLLYGIIVFEGIPEVPSPHAF